MTVTYTHEVANARLGGFSNLLLRWKGSVYKLFYKEFVIYITLYIILSLVYRYIDHPDFKNYFEKLCLQFQSYTDLVPISFVLGFYVSMVVGRWWQQYENIPWPDRLMIVIASNVHGSDNRGRLIRRTLVRYLSLMQVLTYRSISTAVYKRFPTIQHVIDAGFMTTTEYKQYENVKTENVKYFIPCVWFSNLLSKVRQEGRIYDDMTYQTILKELNDFRGCCGMLFSYDWISIPLVYTQVVTVAVYVFFMSTLLSRQYLDVTKGYPGHEVDLYVPIFTICQFFFYVGWLKVAEQLINPFGEDDDDFEVNVIIDRNLEISMLTVDNMYLNHPKLERDIYWNNPNPSIPYTAASANHKMDAFLGSTMDMSLGRNEMQFVGNVDAPPNYENKHLLDVNHNEIGTELKTLHQETPFVPAKQPLTRTNNPVNFWKRFTGREQESEAKKSLLKTEYLSPRASSNANNEKNKSEKRDEDNNDSMTADSDSDDDDDSDVGNSSSDDGSEDNLNQRRSSLSSEDGDDKENLEDDTPCDSQRSLATRKHSIGESEDRPRAKKPKNTSQVQNILNDSKTPANQTKAFSSSKPKRPSLLITNASENDLKKFTGRFTMGRAKKSPKKKINTTKFTKRNEFQRRNHEETEDERRNAQIRTIGLLKANKKKSVQALQRNARRTNYPGNAWLRYNYKYPMPWRTDLTSAGDYASMTSGAEDHGRPEYDSPFGSIISFGTSIPSPRPLRFSQFGKRCRQRNFDSVSASSCLTSPCANEDYSPSFGMYSGSPRSREEYFLQQNHQPPTSSVSMPFTEDLRRRLLVVNTNTPNSSNATSPIMSRAYLGMQDSNHHPLIHSQPTHGENDDLLMIAPTSGPTTSNTWSGKLEVIGESPSNEKTSFSPPAIDSNQKQKSKVSDIQVSTTDKADSQSSPVLAKKPLPTTLPALPHSIGRSKVSSTKPTSPRRNILRSKSCPDVPISKAVKKSSCETEAITSKKVPESDANSSDDNDENSEMSKLLNANNFQSTSTLTNSPKLSSPTHRFSVHWENECNEKGKSAADDNLNEKLSKLANDVITSNTEYAYNKLSHYNSSELAPLLSPDESSKEDEGKDTQHLPQNKPNEVNGNSTADDEPTQPRPTLKHPSSVASDLGYCSAKEEIEISNSSKNLDPLSKIRNLQPSIIPAARSSFHAISENMKKMAPGSKSPKGSPDLKRRMVTKSINNDPEHFSSVQSVVVPITSPSSDDIILEIA